MNNMTLICTKFEKYIADAYKTHKKSAKNETNISIREEFPQFWSQGDIPFSM